MSQPDPNPFPPPPAPGGMMPSDPKPIRRPLGDERGLSPAEPMYPAPRQVDWRIGIGRNRMSWLTRPTHWMVSEYMRPPDGSAAWFEVAHYFAIGPVRLFIIPRLRITAAAFHAASARAWGNRFSADEPAMYPEPPPTAGGPRCRHEVVRWQAHDLFPDIEHDIDSGWDARLTCTACGETFVTRTYAQHLQNIIRDRERQDQEASETKRFAGMSPSEIVEELRNG